MPLIDALTDPSRPVFLFGSTPPREGTTVEKAKEACAKFAARSAVLATDGFIVYDIQDEGGRTTMERPFPFRKTMDPSLYASFFPSYSAKQCVVYKCVVEDSMEGFDKWMDTAVQGHGHTAFNFVGAATSRVKHSGPSLAEAGLRSQLRRDCKFGCVCIPERHTSKGNEDENMLRKMAFGAEWFITQGIFAAGPLITMLNSYGDKCRERNIVPKKVVLTFAPCGRAKTMTFIKWLGMHVPEDVEQRILNSAVPVQESVAVLSELLATVLQQTGGSGVPIGINVESLSIFKEEIDAAHSLFQKLQAILLNSYGSPWAVRWYHVHRPLRRHDSFDEVNGVLQKSPSVISDPVLILLASFLALGGFVAGRYANK
mmetsp:Transcript_5314/g.8692  ORF Transcript_5314/g.8692 Transcript_5314/m.8692 type:complete len:371 (+) Transcript_5314:105-1217(+)